MRHLITKYKKQSDDPPLTTLATIAIFTVAAQSQIIDFETLPNGNPSLDGVPLGSAYAWGSGASANSVSFSLVHTTTSIVASPRFEEVGGTTANGVGFQSTNSWNNQNYDTPATQGAMGQFFLTNGLNAIHNYEFVIDYANPVIDLSGQIWDLDASLTNGYEQYEVTYWLGATKLATQTSPQGLHPNVVGSLDSKAWTFSHGGVAMDQVRISYIGTNTASVGYAFDNFETGTTVVPEPSSTALLGLGTLGLLIRRKR